MVADRSGGRDGYGGGWKGGLIRIRGAVGGGGCVHVVVASDVGMGVGGGGVENRGSAGKKKKTFHAVSHS